jgi:hypothetical protein
VRGSKKWAPERVYIDIDIRVPAKVGPYKICRVLPSLAPYSHRGSPPPHPLPTWTRRAPRLLVPYSSARAPPSLAPLTGSINGISFPGGLSVKYVFQKG